MIFKFLHVVLLASLKYFVTLPYALLIGLEYHQAIIAVLTGGIGGFLFFYYLSRRFNKLLDLMRPGLKKVMPVWLKSWIKMIVLKVRGNNHNRLFSKKSRMIAKVKSTYGYWGIIIATPFILSIPLGAFLTSRYYAHKRHTVPFMILSIVSWTAFLSGIVLIFPKVFF
jgi:hypothetical protein